MTKLKVKLPEFNGLEGAEDFQHKFNLIIEQNEWQEKDKEIIMHFAYCLTGAALTWRLQVSKTAGDVNTWTKVKSLFTERWINNDPAFLKPSDVTRTLIKRRVFGD